jgi:addiction module HigA family antidote
MPSKNPPHPGPLIRAEIVVPFGLSVASAAAALNVSRSALSRLLNAKSGLTAEMAVRIYKAFGVGMNALVAMQASYDVAKTGRLMRGKIKVQRQRMRID